MTPNFEFTNVDSKNIQSFVNMLSKLWKLLARIINGHVGFGDGVNADNIDGVWINVTPPTANTDFTVLHNLGRLPVGYLVMAKSAACDVFAGSIPATKNALTLQASVGAVVLRLFILSLFLCLNLHAQNGIVNDTAQYNSNGFIKALASAVITVCTAPGVAPPCTAKAPVCASAIDAVCTQPNPFNADINGNYTFWIVPGTYTVTITSTKAQARTITYVVVSNGGSGGSPGNGFPGGAFSNLQYFLDSTHFGGVAGSTYDSVTGNIVLPGNVVAGNSTTTGGFLQLPQGPVCSPLANNWSICPQTSISNSGINWIGPNKTGNNASGIVFGNVAGTNNILSQSGDTKHAIWIPTGTATITNQTICLAADCPVGEYELALHVGSAATCATPGPASITPTITFTDNNGTKTNVPIVLYYTATSTLQTNMPLGNTTNYAFSMPTHFWSSGVNPITVSFTMTACTTGTTTFSVGAQIVGKQ